VICPRRAFFVRERARFTAYTSNMFAVRGLILSCRLIHDTLTVSSCNARGSATFTTAESRFSGPLEIYNCTALT
jgi:hypothetical protein